MSSTNRKISPTKKKASSSRLYSNIITTPCEKVLMILRQIKKFILNLSKDQSKLIQNLDWCIKIITSRSLYSYELKEKDNINNLSKINPEFKQLVDFVSEYNEKVIKMNRQYDYILTDKLLQKSSTKLNRRRIERKSSYGIIDSKIFQLLQLEDTNKENKNEKKIFNSSKNKDVGLTRKKISRNSVFNPNLNLNAITTILNDRYLKTEVNPFDEVYIKKKINPKKLKKQIININDDDKILNNVINGTSDSIGNMTSPRLNQTNYMQQKSTNMDCLKKINNANKSKLLNYTNKRTRNKMEIFPSVKTISISINKGNTSNDKNEKNINSYNQNRIPPKRFNSSNAANLRVVNSNSKFKKNSKSKKNISNTIKGYDFSKLQNKLIHEGFDISKSITEKNFNLFELKELIGYNNVLPIMGRVILENLGLLDEEILNTAKLDKFLISVSNQYKQETLYHNALHGSDVTHSVYIFFTHSNAEKIAKTNVLDLLSIIIAALGHDIGHPGLTNTYQINDSTDMAITYNDISVLENFHASTLFRTIRKTDYNIFEKLTTIDYKIIRKRMISEILATDMANHVKVISLIKSKISLNEENKNLNEYKLNLLSGNEQTKIEEQQSLLDFMIHLADLAHNTKLFDVSKKWVELLSEEFWRQGDLEKENNLPVSFLCDRNDVNIPQSQKGFISGYVIPTFESLVSVFPTLRFTLENANHNLKEWQKLLDQGRKTGWTPPKYDENSTRRQNIEINLYKALKNKRVGFNRSGDLGKKEKSNEKNNEANTTSTSRINDHITNRIHKSRNKNNSIGNNSNIISNSYYTGSDKKKAKYLKMDKLKRRNINNTIDNTFSFNNINRNEILQKSEKRNTNNDSRSIFNTKNKSNTPKKITIKKDSSILNKTKEKEKVNNEIKEKKNSNNNYKNISKKFPVKPKNNK